MSLAPETTATVETPRTETTTLRAAAIAVTRTHTTKVAAGTTTSMMTSRIAAVADTSTSQQVGSKSKTITVLLKSKMSLIAEAKSKKIDLRNTKTKRGGTTDQQSIRSLLTTEDTRMSMRALFQGTIEERRTNRTGTVTSVTATTQALHIGTKTTTRGDKAIAIVDTETTRFLSLAVINTIPSVNRKAIKRKRRGTRSSAVLKTWASKSS